MENVNFDKLENPINSCCFACFFGEAPKDLITDKVHKTKSYSLKEILIKSTSVFFVGVNMDELELNWLERNMQQLNLNQ